MSYIINSKEISTYDYTTVYNDDGSTQRISHSESVYVTEEIPCADTVNLCVEISKAKDDEQLVSGWANVSINKDGSIPLDWQDDVIAPDTLEKAAIQFMLDYRDSGVMHDDQPPVGTVVESIVFTKEKQEALGIPDGVVPQGWFITVKVNDPEVFAKVKDGTYKMFSIQGSCNRVKL